MTIRSKIKSVCEPAQDLLGALGFGPDTLLMNDPKLFVDARFLAALLVELEGELGAEGSRAALYQIGLAHGFREAERLARGAFAPGGPQGLEASGCQSTALLMQLGSPHPRRGVEGSVAGGHWPERHEAEARLCRAGLADAPSCYLSAGYTAGWLSGTQERDLLVVEVECMAAGAPRCRFEAIELQDWEALPEHAFLEPIGIPSYQSFRRTALQSEGVAGMEYPVARPPADVPEASCFDPEDNAVHIWGPVMVLPFTQVDEAMATVDMLGRDPATCSVRAVVIDLRGQLLDDGFTAAGLEQVLEAVEAWGAEAILTGVSPFSEAIVGDLEATHLLTRKDLPEAIASAFQIAEAQRHLL